LIDRYRIADPYAQAVLTAALDLTRLGYHNPLSAELLRAAAPGYCTHAQRAKAPADWFDSALTYATSTVLGDLSALLPLAG
jgi:hypothetical protein